jgi:hypothetical protein
MFDVLVQIYTKTATLRHQQKFSTDFAGCSPPLPVLLFVFHAKGEKKKK